MFLGLDSIQVQAAIFCSLYISRHRAFEDLKSGILMTSPGSHRCVRVQDALVLLIDKAFDQIVDKSREKKT